MTNTLEVRLWLSPQSRSASRMRCGPLVQATLHQFNFLLLLDDDSLGETAQNWIVPVN